MPKTNATPAQDLAATIARLNTTALRIAEYDRLESKKPAAERNTPPLQWRIAFSGARKRFLTARAAYLAAYPHRSAQFDQIDRVLGMGEPATATASA